MSKIIQITPSFAVAGQLEPEDFAHAAALGFRTIINNRPDGEERGQLSAAEGRQAAEDNGLAYVHIPTTKHDIFTDAVVGPMADVVAAQAGPILAHCKSGQRSAIAWAAAAARGQPVAEVLATLEDAGLDFGFLRDDLDKQADRRSWSTDTTAKRSSDAAVSAGAAAHAA
ncbi:MAG: TIGR01244 family sulfur transferase [Hyphomicrobiaceae bacterium]|nr:TIGR01244 family sulfur transferase [Hyphomicrobiaceae bacterium]